MWQYRYTDELYHFGDNDYIGKIRNSVKLNTTKSLASAGISSPLKFSRDRHDSNIFETTQLKNILNMKYDYHTHYDDLRMSNLVKTFDQVGIFDYISKLGLIDKPYTIRSISMNLSRRR